MLLGGEDPVVNDPNPLRTLDKSLQQDRLTLMRGKFVGSALIDEDHAAGVPVRHRDVDPLALHGSHKDLQPVGALGDPPFGDPEPAQGRHAVELDALSVQEGEREGVAREDEPAGAALGLGQDRPQLPLIDGAPNVHLTGREDEKHRSQRNRTSSPGSATEVAESTECRAPRHPRCLHVHSSAEPNRPFMRI